MTEYYMLNSCEKREEREGTEGQYREKKRKEAVERGNKLDTGQERRN